MTPPTAVTRLFDLGVEPYLVGASLSAVLAQRLVRMLHPDCRGLGCDGCLTTGFKGRTGLFELLLVDETIRELIGANAGLSEIRQAARQLFNGHRMRTLREDGDRLVEAGITSAHRSAAHGAGSVMTSRIMTGGTLTSTTLWRYTAVEPNAPASRRPRRADRELRSRSPSFAASHRSAGH